MKKIINFKYMPFVEIVSANLILILISNFMVRDILSLLTNSFNNAIFFIVLMTIILTLIFSIIKIIVYLINYKIIKLLFMGTDFSENIKSLDFLSIMGITSILSSFILLFITIILNMFINKDILINNWQYITDKLVVIFNMIALIVFGIYVQKKIKNNSKLKCVFFVLIPYTVYNLSIFIIKVLYQKF